VRCYFCHAQSLRSKSVPPASPLLFRRVEQSVKAGKIWVLNRLRLIHEGARLLRQGETQEPI